MMKSVEVQLENGSSKSVFCTVAMFFLAAALVIFAIGPSPVQAQKLKPIQLSRPDKNRGLPIMKALSLRHSTQAWSTRALPLRDLSDLMWAADGINRPNKKKTAASALNAQDVDIYVFMKKGVYLYDAAHNALNPVVAGDHRSDIAMTPPGGGPRPGGAPGGASGAAPAGRKGGPPAGMSRPQPGHHGRQSADQPAILLLVSNNAKFPMGTAAQKYEWGCIDTGIVAQNIMLYCSGTGLVTHPKAAISQKKMKSLLNLKDTQKVLLELQVGFPKK